MNRFRSYHAQRSPKSSLFALPLLCYPKASLFPLPLFCTPNSTIFSLRLYSVLRIQHFSSLPLFSVLRNQPFFAFLFLYSEINHFHSPPAQRSPNPNDQFRFFVYRAVLTRQVRGFGPGEERGRGSGRWTDGELSRGRSMSPPSLYKFPRL